MSALADAIGAIREALKLTDDVRRAGETVKEVARELREHDRRITRLEAQWETALALTQRSAPRPRKLDHKPSRE